MRLSFHSMRLAMNASKQRRSNLINQELSAHNFNLQLTLSQKQSADCQNRLALTSIDSKGFGNVLTELLVQKHSRQIAGIAAK